MHRGGGAACIVILGVQHQRGSGVGVVQGRYFAEDAAVRFEHTIVRGSTMAGLAVIHAVDLLAAQAEQVGQPVGGITQIAQVALIHHTGPVSHDHGAALGGVIAKRLRKFVAQQVLHRHNNQPIAGQVALLVDKIHRNTAACQGVVVAGSFQ